MDVQYTDGIASKSVILPEPFHGTNSWNDWIENFEHVAVVNVATHLSPSIPPCMLHSLIIDPVPDCTSDVGSYRSAHRSDPCLCAGLRAGTH